MKLKEELYFVPLGGSGEIGMNLNLYCYEDKYLMIDCGVSFEQHLGVEIVMPDPTFIEKQKDKLIGIVLTHAHEDHLGAIPHLWNRFECPIYATPFTAYLAREKLKEAGLAKRAKVTEIKPRKNYTLKPFDIELIPVTHSIPEQNAIHIQTPAGNVLHTGDWKLDDSPFVGEKTDVEYLKKIGDQGVLALVCDSTNVFVEGATGSELTVRENLIKLVKKQPNRVVISCFASNIARLETCAMAAKATGRHLVLCGRSMFKMWDAAKYAGYLKDIPQYLKDDKAMDYPPEKILIACTGSQAEPRAALTRIAAHQHAKIRLRPNDTVIFSSRIIPGNEKEIYDLQDKLIEQDLNVITEDDVDGIHVSGHPARDDLKQMYDWVRPEIVIPVHGEKAHLREQAQFAKDCGVQKSLAPYNGSYIQLSGDRPRIVDEVPVGKLGVDGTQVVPLYSEQMRDRSRLMNGGVIAVTIVFKKNGQLNDEPHVSLLGVVEETKVADIMDEIAFKIQDAIRQMPQQDRDSDQMVSDCSRIMSRRVITADRGKKPIVVTHIVRL